MTERSNLPSAADLFLSFGTPAPEAGSTSSPAVGAPAVEAKRARLQETALQKMAVYGTPAEQRVVATGIVNGNRISEDQGLKDLDLAPLDYIEKYGYDAFVNRANFSDAYLGLLELQNAERSGGDTAKDSALDVGVGLVNTAGGAASALTASADQTIRAVSDLAGLEEAPILSPYVSMATSWATEGLQDQQSQLMQDRREQLAIAAELDRADNEAAYQEELAAAEASGSDSIWDTAISPWLKKQGRAIGDTAGNYADDPMMLGSLGAEGVGSLLPVAGQAKLVGMVGKGRALAAGATAEEAAAAGLLAAERAVPLTIGLTEGGSAVSQVQQEIMSMPEEDLAQSPEYQELLAGGTDPEQARLILARDAGTAAGLVAAPGAILAGKIAAPFEARPMASAMNPLNAGRNVGKEAIEEFLQEGNTQLASNVAMDQVAGIETALDENVAESATAGAMGGAMVAGGLQAPGAAAGATKAVTSAAIEKAGQAVKARMEGVEAAIDAESATGTAARQAAATNIAAAGEELLTPADGNQETASEEAPAAPAVDEDGEPTDVEARMLKGIFLSPDEAEQYGGAKTRGEVVNGAEAVLTNPEATDEDKFFASLQAVRNFDDLAKAGGADIAQEVDTLPEDHRARRVLGVLQNEMQTLESSPALAQAREFLNGLSDEKVREFVPVDEILEGGTDEQKLGLAQMFETIALAKPEALSDETYSAINDQLGGIGAPGRKILQRNLELAQEIAREFADVSDAKAKIQAGYDSVIEGQTEEADGRFKAWDTVREEIQTDGNQNNGLPSLNEHRRRVLTAIRSGRLVQAQDALVELQNFAQHQINKIEAYNKSARAAGGPKTSFKAYGPRGWFTDDQGVYANLKSPKSVAMIQEAAVDAHSAVNLANALSESLGLARKEQTQESPLAVPELDASLVPVVQEVIKPLTRGRAPKRPAGRRPQSLKQFVVAAGGIWKGDANIKDVPEYRRPGFVKKERLARSAAGDNKGGRTLDELREMAAEAGYLPMESTVSDFLDLLDGDVRGDLNHAQGDLSAAADWADYDTAMEGWRSMAPARAARPKKAAKKDLGEAVAKAARTPKKPDPKPEPAATQEVEETQEVTPISDDADSADTDQTDGDQDLDTDVNEDAAPEDTAVTATKTWFYGLAQVLYGAARGTNRFLNAFRPATNGRSLLHTHADPAAFMIQNLGSLAQKGGLAREFSTTEQKALKKLLTAENVGLPGFAKALEEMVQAQLGKKPRDLAKDKRAWGQRLSEQDDQVAGFGQGLLLNFLQKLPDGSMELEPRVVAATFMAATEWAIQNLNPPRTMSDEDVARLFGMGRAGAHLVNGHMRAVSRFGISHQMAIETISTKISELLGVNANKGVTVSLTEGGLKALASNALEVLLDQGVIEVTGPDGQAWDPKARVKDKDGNRVPVKIGAVVDTLTRNPETGRMDTPGKQTIVMIRTSDRARHEEGPYHALKTVRDPFTRVFTRNAEKDRYIGEPPKRVNEFQIGNEFAPISRMARKVLKRLNNSPAYVNEPLLALIDAIGDGTYKAFLGYTALDEGDEARYSKAHLESIKGKNQSLDRGLDEARGYIDEARLHGEKLGEVKIFFDHAISSVGRIQQQGPVTPQNDKTARELLSQTFSTITLDKPAHMEAFWLAVAQSVGMKVEKEPHGPEKGFSRGVLKNAQDIFQDPNGLKPAVDNVRQLLSGGKFDGPALIQQIQDARDAGGKGFAASAKLLHAVLTVAQLEEAKAKEEKTLRTALALEADGRTDGPGNAMIHMGTGLFGREGRGKLSDGEFTPDEIERFAKVGLFFTDAPLSLNDYIAMEARSNPEKIRGEDLYHMAARLFADRLNALHGGKPSEAAEAVLRILDALHSDFSLAGPDSDRLVDEISRNLVKNPLTVFLYGSGEDGIAGKITGEILSNFYRALSVAIAGWRDGEVNHVIEHAALAPYEGLLEDLYLLTGTNLEERLMSEPENFVFGTKDIQAIQKAVLEHFAGPMIEAVDEATGGLAANMKLTQRAATVQTAIFKDLLNQGMAARLRELREEGALGEKDLLSEKDMREVFSATMAMAPIYGTDAETFHISAPRKEPEGKPVAESIRGRFSVKARETKGADASVKVSPYMTIGTGDGRMILNIYANSDGSLDASLPVFDGVEQSIADVDGASPQINEAVFEGWTGQNLYESLSDGYWQMLSSLTEDVFNTLSDGTLMEISRAMDLRNSKGKLVRPRLQHVQAIQQGLESRAQISAARKAAIKAMPTQTDHMAGARRAHGRKGTIEWKGGPLDFAGIAETMNKVYREELARVQQERSERTAEVLSRPDYAQPESTAMVNMVKELGEEVEGHKGVYRLRGEQLLPLFGEATDTTQEQSRIFWRVLMKDPAFKNASYYFGKAEALEGVRDELGLGGGRIQHGQAHTGVAGGDVVFVANQSPETLLHEMLHVHTRGVLDAYMADPDSAPAHVREAVTRLSGLANVLLDMDPGMAGDAAEALVTAQMHIQNLDGDPAAQISELISYALTNQELISLAQKKKVYGPIAQFVRKVLKELKALLGITSHPGDTLWSNIRFNTELLIGKEQAEAKAQDRQTAAVSEQIHGADARLERIERTYLERLQEHLEAGRPKGADPAGGRAAEYEMGVARMRLASAKAIEDARAHFFALNGRQARAFEAVHATMMSGLKLNPVLMRQVNLAYAHAMRSLSEEDLLKASGITGTPSPREAYAAERQLVFLATAGDRINPEGKTDVLATFMALAMTNDMVREAFGNLTPLKANQVKKGSVDSVLEGLAATVVNLLTNLSLKRRRQPRTVREQLDVLAGGLAEIQGQNRFAATAELMGRSVNRTNDWMAEQLKKGSEKSADWLSDRAKKIGNNKARGALNVASMVAALGSKEKTEANGEALTTILNHTPGYYEARALLNDLRGATKTNMPLLRLINRVRSTVDAMRQDYREAIPEELAKRFSRKLSRHEWTALFDGVAKSDLLAVGAIDGMALMRDPASVTQRIQAEEARLANMGGRFTKRYLAKAKALAVYMTTGEVTSEHLLSNARAIAHLFGERGNDGAAIDAQVNQALLKSISRLTSLYAYESLDQATKDRLKVLANEESEGVETLVQFQRRIREAELERLQKHGKGSRVAENNGWKGYVPSVVQEGASVIVADDSRSAELIRQGYTRIGDYKGDAREAYVGKRGYYQSSVSGRNSFRQGVAQTVHDTWEGVDIRFGHTRSEAVNGTVMGGAASRIAKAAARNAGRNDGKAPGEYLIPRFDENGEVVSYERPLAPQKLAGLQKDTHLGRMMGVWLGRIYEEEMAHQSNLELLKTLKEIWENEKDSKDAEFVNVADRKQADPIIADAWGTMGGRIRQDAAEVFGRYNFVPVRRDMVNDAIGFRAAGLTDPWTGNTRWSPEAQKRIRDFATLTLGKKAYKRLAQTEEIVGDAVSYAKTTIIVRSIQVAWENILSNVLHLSLYGINPIKMATLGREKFLEVHQYVANQRELKELEVDLAKAGKGSAERARVEARIKAIGEINDRMSIKPLLEAGEFSTISESLTEADVAIREGRWGDFMEQAAEKLPGWSKTVGKNVLITKDTALFKGLNRMVQYGDFVAKAVLYDHLTQERGMGREEALDTLMEEFVQYNRLPGRGRDFAESMGLLWFFNYKLRITKIAMKMWRERPLQSLLVMGGAGPMAGVETTWSGSLPAKVWDGGIWFAVGPEMGLGAPSLHPWYNFSR